MEGGGRKKEKLNKQERIILSYFKFNGSGLGILLGRIQMQLKSCAGLEPTGHEEGQRRPGRGQLWKRHREKEGRGER
jgi:hypothetical protein